MTHVVRSKAKNREREVDVQEDKRRLAHTLEDPEECTYYDESCKVIAGGCAREHGAWCAGGLRIVKRSEKGVNGTGTDPML
jgi:hypothetical protein